MKTQTDKAQLVMFQRNGAQPAKPADQRMALTWFARMRGVVDAATEIPRPTHGDRKATR